MQKKGLSLSPPALERIKGVAAIPNQGASADEVPQALKGEDVRQFREAGWTFVGGRKAMNGAYAVFKDGDGRIKIDTGGMTVRFDESVSAEEAAALLQKHGLQIRRKLGFAPNLYSVSWVAGPSRGTDTVTLARTLEGSDKVKYAQADLLEALGGRR